MRMKPLFVLSIICFAVLGVALARNGFETMAYKTLKLEWVANTALARAKCQICHVKASGDAPWNSFGLAVGFWRGKKQTVPDAVYSAVRYGGDSDRDGFPDVLEKFIGTNPNAKDSKPSEKLTDLLKRFDANYKLEVDTDLDGFADAIEILVGSLPGDASSRPSQSKIDLEQQLEVLGGVSFFAPK
jgi:hypothetical protein